MSIHPAPVGHGVWFRRSDVTQGDAMVLARWFNVEQTALCTRLVNPDGVTISTIEHVMAALAGCGIHNVLIEIDGPEAPILDGSALPFVRGLMAAGIAEQAAPLEVIRILKPVEVSRGDATARLDICDGSEMQFDIDFADQAIGQQQKKMSLANGAFLHELCDSRTFCRNADVISMRAQGLALGGNLENAVVFDGDQVLSPGGLRRSDEPVRHKMLDAMGDLYLAGAPLLARYHGSRAGHALTNELLRAVFADPSAYAYETCDVPMMARLPGAGISAADLHGYA